MYGSGLKEGTESRARVGGELVTSISQRNETLKIRTDETGGFLKLKIGLVDS